MTAVVSIKDIRTTLGVLVHPEQPQFADMNSDQLLCALHLYGNGVIDGTNMLPQVDEYYEHIKNDCGNCKFNLTCPSCRYNE